MSTYNSAAAMTEKSPMLEKARAQLAPTGVLRAGLNMGNFLLITGRTAEGDPHGCAPDMARAIAARLDVPVKMIPYSNPAELGDAVDTNAWDIGLIGAEPQRAERIAFTAAYLEIEATYLVPAGSPIKSITEVDRPGVSVVASVRSAYGLWLKSNIKHATLVLVEGLDASFNKFVGERLDALSGLRPGLIEDARKIPGARILDGRFTVVQQAVGTSKRNAEGAAFLRDFVEELKASGFVKRLIEKHGMVGRLSVAPPG